MKYSIFLILILFGCSQKIEFQVSGTLVNSCVQSQPFANATLRFQVDGAVYGVANTDEYGRFNISGEWNQKPIGYDECMLVWDLDPTGPGNFLISLAELPSDGAALDTIYAYPSQDYEICLDISQPVYGLSDTLYFRFLPPSGSTLVKQTSVYGDNYFKAYPGPFSTGVLDTLQLEVHATKYYHSSEPMSLEYWINDKQDWSQKNPSNTRLVYSKPGYVPDDNLDCNSVLSLKLSL